jgi:GTPase SAR1 family protein
MSKQAFLENHEVNYELWDTGSQFRQYCHIQNIARPYFENLNAVIICYDIKDKDSFENIEGHLNDLNRNIDHQNLIITLAANKCDLPISRW